MAAPAYRFPDFWTEADLEALPDDGHRYEIINGSLVMTPPPTDGHQSIGAQLFLALRHAAPPKFGGCCTNSVSGFPAEI